MSDLNDPIEGPLRRLLQTSLDSVAGTGVTAPFHLDRAAGRGNSIADVFGSFDRDDNQLQEMLHRAAAAAAKTLLTDAAKRILPESVHDAYALLLHMRLTRAVAMRYCDNDFRTMQRVARPFAAPFRPGDIVGMRGMFASRYLHEAMSLAIFDEPIRNGERDIDPFALNGEQTRARLAHDAFSDEAVQWLLAERTLGLLFGAVPHFLDSAAAAALVEAEDPDDELIDNLRLPYEHVLLFFDRPVALQERLAAISEPSPFALVREIDDSRSEASLADTQVQAVIISAGPGGVGIDDTVVWLVCAPAEHTGGRARYAIGEGSLRTATGASAVRSLAAAVAYADWKAPQPPADGPVPGTKEFYKALRHNKVRRAEEQGAYAGVHVIDLGRTVTRHGVDANTTGRTVAPHLRRGHWRSVRIATRDETGAIIGDRSGVQGRDWHYEGRFVAPTVVNLAHGAPRSVAYRVDPDKAAG
ncbi:MAG TPA: hypothetical protein VHD87_12935 [Acidimicrobiales bacterium]|nr:hypothetical protein [Acidimicrobiales bacterium]